MITFIKGLFSKPPKVSATDKYIANIQSVIGLIDTYILDSPTFAKAKSSNWEIYSSIYQESVTMDGINEDTVLASLASKYLHKVQCEVQEMIEEVRGYLVQHITDVKLCNVKPYQIILKPYTDYTNPLRSITEYRHSSDIVPVYKYTYETLASLIDMANRIVGFDLIVVDGNLLPKEQDPKVVGLHEQVPLAMGEAVKQFHLREVLPKFRSKVIKHISEGTLRDLEFWLARRHRYLMNQLEVEFQIIEKQYGISGKYRLEMNLDLENESYITVKPSLLTIDKDY